MALPLVPTLLIGGAAYIAVTRFMEVWNSDEDLLDMHGAKPADPVKDIAVCAMVQDLAQRVGVPVPKVYVIKDPFPNAFALGRNEEHSAIVVTDSLDKVLLPEEVEGILAHEFTHIKNHDVVLMTAAAVLKDVAGLIAFGSVAGNTKLDKNSSAAKFPLAAIATLGAKLIGEIAEMAVSRSREYEADKGAGEITGKPEHLAHALQKIETYTANMMVKGVKENNAHLYTANPVGINLKQIFSTHPPTGERVARLLQQALGLGRKLAAVDLAIVEQMHHNV